MTRTSGHDGIDVGHLWKCLELAIAPIMHKTIVWNISYRYILSCGDAQPLCMSVYVSYLVGRRF